MSKPVNPFAIGSFAVGAVLLLVIGILVFGGGQLFKADEIRYVIFFESSLNGLEKGAPVKMQGVKIGKVTEIALQFDSSTNKVFKPVVVEIDRNSFSATAGSSLSKAMTQADHLAQRNQLVSAGFRARLEIQSLLTGLLYVDLDMHTDKPPLYTKLQYKGLLELPGILATTDEIRNTLEEVAIKIRALPLEEIIQDFAESLRDVRNLLASDDLKTSQTAMAKMLVETEKMVNTLNSNLAPLLKNTNDTIISTHSLVQNLHNDLKPILISTDQALKTATTTLILTQESMTRVGDAVGPESTLTETLESLNDAAQSIKNLTDYLERHPESIILGKDY
jgi:paraquat-inducible protein B